MRMHASRWFTPAEMPVGCHSLHHVLHHDLPPPGGTVSPSLLIVPPPCPLGVVLPAVKEVPLSPAKPATALADAANSAVTAAPKLPAVWEGVRWQAEPSNARLCSMHACICWLLLLLMTAAGSGLLLPLTGRPVAWVTAAVKLASELETLPYDSRLLPMLLASNH